MSDVEKAISGLVEDEELQQQQQSTPLNKTNINKYNLQHETGGTTLLQKSNQQHPHRPHSQQHHNHNHKHHHHQEVSCNSSSTVTATTNNYLTTQQYNCNCLSRLAKLIFSTPGLVVMVVVYTIMGAFIFPLLEAPQDISKSALIAKSREECLKELWIITEKLNVLYERNWTMLVHEQLRRFEGTIVAATRNMATAGGSGGGATSATAGATTGGYAGMATDTLSSSSSSSATTALSRYGNNNFAEYSDLTATRWSFSEALLYSVTVITTIGHGSLTPRTAGGKIATIFYALIGVPLMLMCLSSLGALLAEALQCTYARLCCRWPQYAVNGGDDLDDEMLRHKHKHLQHAAKKRQQRPTTTTTATTTTNNISMDMIMLEKEGTHHEIKQSLHQQCDFQEHQNAINCKNCKYDAIIGESNTNTNYDYKLCNDAMAAAAASVTASTSLSLSSTTSVDTTTISSAMTTTMKLGHKEDCCQLLQNSPGKFTQHLSSCMQLRMSPTITVSSSGGTASTTIAAGTASSTAKQYYQQRPDVMLMTTGHKLSSQQPTTMATNGNGRMVVLPPPPPHSASPSPSPASTVTQQRFYQNTTGQPAMATYHIVTSASANSSPTHQQSIRHYILPQLTAGAIPPPPTSSSSAGTQHYMAVPTNMLRFQQTTPQTQSQQQQQQQQQQQYGNNIVNNTTSNMNMNMNPLSLPVSGSATVYFPIVTPAAALQNTSLTSAPLSSAISQPIIKYHTIQMPHKRQQNVMMLQQSDLRNDKQRNETLNNTEDAAAADAAQFPPPPPPAYQTATVHGIRRAKFLTKPLPQEINTLLQESDISCRHDLSQHLQTAFTSTAMGTEGVGVGVEGNCVGGEQQMLAQHTPTTAHSIMLSTGRTENTAETETSMTTTAVTTNLSSFYGGISSNIASSSSTPPPPPPATPPPSSLSPSAGMLTLNNIKTNTNNNNSISATTTTAATIYENHPIMLTREGQLPGTQDTITRQQGHSDGSRTTTAVDIMEDEEENEQQRLGNCPHGTPSRVPLLTSSSCSSNNDDKSHTRSFLNATAASFHRHTLNTFHRSANAPLRKSVIINRKGECNLHIPKRRNSSGTTTVCYGGDPYDDMLMTSDDDCGMLEGQNVYKLKHLQPFNKQTDKHLIDQVDFCDNNSLVSLADSVSQIPQVPIIVVLFILIFYVSLGTVIFALWENWSLIDGAYFCFVTLTTIGYGDFVPLKTFQGPEIQLFACCAYLLLGLVLVAMAFSILETQLIWKCKRLAVRLKLAKE